MKTKEQIYKELLPVAKMSGDWIESYIDLYNIDTSLDAEEVFALGLNSIKLGMVKELSRFFSNNVRETLDFVIQKGYNESQIQIILKALTDSKDYKELLEWITNNITKEIPYSVMNYVILGYMDGIKEFNIDFEEMIKFNQDQLATIYACIKDELEYKDLLNPGIPSEYMEIIRHARYIGLKAEFNSDNKVVVF